MRILPEGFKFAPVRVSQKNVTNWDELENLRAQHAPVLGQDDWWEVLKYNFSNVLFCDLMSKAFGWVLIANGILLYLLYKDADHPTWEMTSTTTWFAWCHAIGANLHFAAKDEFKKVIAAACSRWAGGTDVIRGPVSTTVTTMEAKK